MVNNTKIIQFNDIIDKRNVERPQGHLTPIENLKDIPFKMKRIYYLTRVPENTIRGFHAHKQLEQILVCLNGSVEVSVSTPFVKEIVKLDDPAKGLYVGPMVWREMYNFSPGSVLVVLASELYDENDYIRDYRKYCEEAQEYFRKENKENEHSI